MRRYRQTDRQTDRQADRQKTLGQPLNMLQHKLRECNLLDACESERDPEAKQSRDSYVRDVTRSYVV